MKKHEGDITTYTQEFLDCRENHLWRWTNDWGLTTGHRGKLLEFTRTKECERCHTKAHRRYDGTTGRVISGTYYEYADGYLSDTSKPGNRIDAGKARLEMLRRAGVISTKGQKSGNEGRDA